jgi:hypothetical protein
MQKFIILLSALLFVGCANKKEEEKKDSFTPTPTGLNGIKQTATTSASLNTNQTPNNLISNPKHGEPGHRCDIAVGAPLNSKPQTPVQNQQSQTAATPVQITPGQETNKPVITKTNGLNPKHGEPGHRCDIAVGAPLNGVAKQTNNVTMKQTAKATVAPIAEPKVETKTAADPKNQKLNPAHGEPNHRCDLAVGAPLN